MTGASATMTAYHEERLRERLARQITLKEVHDGADMCTVSGVLTAIEAGRLVVTQTLKGSEKRVEISLLRPTTGARSIELLDEIHGPVTVFSTNGKSIPKLGALARYRSKLQPHALLRHGALFDE